MPVASDFHLVHHRLAALERLTSLFERGTLTASELAAEKALVLRLPADELVFRGGAARHRAPRGPSLLGRLFNWKLVPLGIAFGAVLSLYAQPNELLALIERTGRLLI